MSLLDKKKKEEDILDEKRYQKWQTRETGANKHGGDEDSIIFLLSLSMSHSLSAAILDFIQSGRIK